MIANSEDQPLDDSDYKILAVGPPPAICLDTFVNRYECANVFVNEQVEGTMVNVFYDARNGHWEMATKHAVCGKYWYYRTDYGEIGGIPNKTFRRMFVEAFSSMFLDNEVFDCGTTEDKWLDEILPFLKTFPKEYVDYVRSNALIQKNANTEVLGHLNELYPLLMKYYVRLDKQKSIPVESKNTEIDKLEQQLTLPPTLKSEEQLTLPITFIGVFEYVISQPYV
jgi:hypothetical protein